MQLDVRHLRVVAAVADAGSISAAARELGVAQPTLTVQLRRIEQECGDELFSRTADGVRPTGTGRLVLRHARTVLGALSDIDEAVRAAPAAEIRVAAGCGQLHRVLPELVRLRPDAAWRLRTCSPAAAWQALQRDGCDVVVRLVWPHVPPPRRDGVVGETVAEGPLQVLLPADGPDPAGRVVDDLAEFADRPWVVRSDPAARRSVLAVCGRAGFAPEVRHTADEPEAVAALVLAGGAVALEPGAGTCPPGVVALPVRDAPHHRVEVLARTEGLGWDVLRRLREQRA